METSPWRCQLTCEHACAPRRTELRHQYVSSDHPGRRTVGQVRAAQLHGGSTAAARRRKQAGGGERWRSEHEAELCSGRGTQTTANKSLKVGKSFLRNEVGGRAPLAGARRRRLYTRVLAKQRRALPESLRLRCRRGSSGVKHQRCRFTAPRPASTRGAGGMRYATLATQRLARALACRRTQSRVLRSLSEQTKASLDETRMTAQALHEASSR